MPDCCAASKILRVGTVLFPSTQTPRIRVGSIRLHANRNARPAYSSGRFKTLCSR